MKTAGRIERVDGEFVIDAAFVAAKFDLDVDQARTMMRRGLFRSLVEKGEGTDAGQWRLSLRCGNRVWQAVLSADGTIRHEGLGLAGGSKTPPRSPSGSACPER